MLKWNFHIVRNKSTVKTDPDVISIVPVRYPNIRMHGSVSYLYVSERYISNNTIRTPIFPWYMYKELAPTCSLRPLGFDSVTRLHYCENMGNSLSISIVRSCWIEEDYKTIGLFIITYLYFFVVGIFKIHMWDIPLIFFMLREENNHEQCLVEV